MIKVSNRWKKFGNILKYLGMLINNTSEIWGDLQNFSRDLPFHSYSFPSHENFMKSFWKLKAIVPNDFNHWTPKTTSKPAIGIAIIELFNTYSPIYWYYDISLSNLWFLHLQSLLETLVLDIQSNYKIWLIYNEWNYEYYQNQSTLSPSSFLCILHSWEFEGC